MALTEKQKRFAFEYVVDFNATKAAIRASYSEASAHSQGPRLLENVEIQAEIEEHKEMLARVSRCTRAWVLDQWFQIASADPKDLVKVTVNACPDCHDATMKGTLIAAGLAESLQVPNPKCELCKGHGVRGVWLADTGKLKGPAARLYAGAKQTKDGIEIKMRDQDGALKSIANYFGMEKTQLSGPGGGPIAIAAMSDAKQLTEEQLEAIVNAQLGVSSGVSEGRQPLTLEGSTT